MSTLYFSPSVAEDTCMNIMFLMYYFCVKVRTVAGKEQHWYDSPAHGEVCDKVHHVMGGLSLFCADDTHLLVLVVAAGITCQS